MREINRIIVHCAATPNGQVFTAEDVLHWHTDPKPRGRGWKHAGYHFVIELDGKASPLVALDDDRFIEPWEIANGAKGYNQDSVHVCLIGTDRFTEAQWDTLHRLVADLGLRFPGATVHGHREFNPHKICPGFDVSLWLTEPARIEREHLLDSVEDDG
ncbi:MAG: lysozyme [Candidatus Dadabacteria bacterium]|nr:MAG: lysozyme [Candidatus Dadabacteria bacterium]